MICRSLQSALSIVVIPFSLIVLINGSSIVEGWQGRRLSFPLPPTFAHHRHPSSHHHCFWLHQLLRLFHFEKYFWRFIYKFPVWAIERVPLCLFIPVKGKELNLNGMVPIVFLHHSLWDPNPRSVDWSAWNKVHTTTRQSLDEVLHSVFTSPLLEHSADHPTQILDQQLFLSGVFFFHWVLVHLLVLLCTRNFQNEML